MNSMLDTLITVTVVLLMTLVGTGLTATDLRRVARRPRLVSLVTLGQLALLPLLAVATGRVLGDADLTASLVLIGAAPGGALSNVYTYLLRGDVGLSVTLTAVTTAIAAVTMPAAVQGGFLLALGRDVAVTVPAGRIAGQLVLTLLLPVALGMFLRGRWPEVVRRGEASLRRVGLLATAGLIGIVLTLNSEGLGSALLRLVPAAVLYTLGAAAIGALTARTLAADDASRVAIVIEFTCRNTPAAILVAALVLARADLALFAAVLLLTQVPLVAALPRLSGLRAATSAAGPASDS